MRRRDDCFELLQPGARCGEWLHRPVVRVKEFQRKISGKSDLRQDAQQGDERRDANVVIEPEFRGSMGFGSRLFRAGWKQWGLGMQDDLADAAQWAVKQGFADEKRMCIAGASYGGYATLMGLIKHPELFRCGVAWVGVSDIDLLYSNDWSDVSDVWKTHGMPKLVGDRVKDAAQLAATSPLRRAAELRQPLLMAYGSDDRRVPLEHGTKMRDALRPHHRHVEFVVYPGEGHGFMLESSNIDFWTRVDTFLARQLAPPTR